MRRQRTKATVRWQFSRLFFWGVGGLGYTGQVQTHTWKILL